MNQKNKKQFILASVAVVAVGALFVPVKSVVNHNLECKSIHDNLRIEKKNVIDETNSLEIFNTGEPRKAQVSTHGGCGSINPLVIQISKSYEGDLNGGDALSSVRNNLKDAGYSITSENFGSEGCKAIYRAEANKANVKMYVALSQEKKKITGCTDGYPTEISEQVFSNQIIEKALVKPL